jgi:Ca-activated chloride channel family protein
MSEFHFIRPLWFIALLPLVFMLWQLHRQKRRSNGWQQIIPSHLVNHLIQGESTSAHQPFWLLAVVWLIVVSAIAGPTWEKLPQPVYQTNTGKVLVMDMSMSMRATDLKPDRLTKARFKAIDLIEKIDDSDMGLVAYSGDAFVISPLTADSKNLTALIPSLSPEIMPVAGSDPLSAFELADTLLKNAGYATGEIYLLTDGIDQEDVDGIRDFITNSQHRVSILGIGTAEGAPIKQISGELLKDRRGSIVIPKLIDARLRSIAKSSGGAYSRITSTDIDIEQLAQQEVISREAKKDDNQMHQGDQFKEFGPYLVLLILPFAAYAFRRGLVVCAVLGFSLMTAPQARADWWQDMWQTKDQQAAKQYNADNFADAAQTFDDNQWKGSSAYKSGDFEAALSEFQKSNDATGLYNQGNAHAKLNNLDEGIKAYEKALELDPDMEDAKKNLEILKKAKEEQEKQEGEDGEEGEEGEEGDKQDGDKDQQKQDGEESGEGEDKDQESQDQEGEGNDPENKPEPRPSEGDEEDGKKDAQNRDPNDGEEGEEEEQSKPGEEKEGEGEEGEEKTQQIKPAEPTTEEKEQMQEIQQLLRKIPDDPSILLRNKMRLEYQKRKLQNASPPGAKKW